MKRILIAIAMLMTASACADGGDTCTDTYADGLHTAFSGTSCDYKQPPPDVATNDGAGITDPNACTITYAFGCNDQGTDCKEQVVRECPGGVLEKTLEPGCRKTSNPAYDFDAITVRSRDAFNFELNGVAPWQAAVNQFNALFNDGGSPQLSFTPARTITPTQITKPQISEFQFLKKGVFPDFPDAAGLTRCGDSAIFGRSNCIVSLIFDNIRRSTEITGESLEDTAVVTALHELGHVACIQHLATDVNQPHSGLDFTAMNSFQLIDDVNPALAYFTYDPTELGDARQAFEDGRTLPPAGTVFSPGFDAD